MLCDLCNKPISSFEQVIIPLWEMKQAVRDGFNPWKTPGLDMSSASGSGTMTPEAMFLNWFMFVMNDTADWGLCPSCAETLRRASKVKNSVNSIEKQTTHYSDTHQKEFPGSYTTNDEWERAKKRAQEKETKVETQQYAKRDEQQMELPSSYTTLEEWENAKKRARNETKAATEQSAKKFEEKKQSSIQAKRKAAGQCIMCGKSLGFFDRVSGREQHRNCSTLEEDNLK